MALRLTEQEVRERAKEGWVIQRDLCADWLEQHAEIAALRKVAEDAAIACDGRVPLDSEMQALRRSLNALRKQTEEANK